MAALALIFSGVLFALILPTWLYPVLVRLRVVDVPNDRSSHTTPTVRGMGAALVIAACLTAAFLVAIDVEGDGYTSVASIALMGAAAAALGFVEDLRGIRVAKRAGLQLLIGAGFGGLIVLTAGVGWIWIPVSAIAVAAYINVANFMDGINGISGLHGGVAGISYAILGALSDRLWMTHLGLIVAGVFVAFLPWNLAGRGVFLGDVGSYFLGAWIAGIAVTAVASGLSFVVAVGPTVIYLADTGYTLVNRIRRGERWFEAHRSHVYQQLASRGGKHVPVALLVAGFSLLTATVSLLTLNQTWTVSAGALVLMLLIAAVYLCLPRIFGGHELLGDPG